MKQMMTRSVWWLVPVIWLPVAFYFIKMSHSMGLTLPLEVIMSIVGAFVWTFHEYCLHRFLFHLDTKSYWGNTFHYLIHGCHHKHPNDGLRLVRPPAVAAIIALMIWNLYGILFTHSIRSVMFGGGLIGYVIYDITHYYVHYGQPTKQSMKSIKKYHLNHHFRIQNKGFGITTTLWDKVFGTLPKTKAAEKSG
ncbi:dihydroceramide fatty acyl 2-hydroxylase FAH1-like isoform X5 [Hibiscus syriacus]|uniref:dihydroceramide fatty acyl 2-hydroxylase FAH1-like isoform X5 n=1 Tax=Hibiscus syriacus TaxID=106335 RepID=UPI0019224495|nr:dihydroceramide fatty acyl 2-hydroxylase FAH1-like isoform X5 [Hibiscus syriacus]